MAETIASVGVEIRNLTNTLNEMRKNQRSLDPFRRPDTGAVTRVEAKLADAQQRLSDLERVEAIRVAEVAAWDKRVAKIKGVPDPYGQYLPLLDAIRAARNALLQLASVAERWNADVAALQAKFLELGIGVPTVRGTVETAITANGVMRDGFRYEADDVDRVVCSAFVEAWYALHPAMRVRHQSPVRIVAAVTHAPSAAVSEVQRLDS